MKRSVTRYVVTFMVAGNVLCLLYLTYLAVGADSLYDKFGENIEIGEMYRSWSYLGLSLEQFILAGLLACVASLVLTWRTKCLWPRLLVLCLSVLLWVVIISNDFGQGVP